jgi:integrase
VEFRKLIAAAQKRPHRGLWWEAFLTLAYTSGARAGELTHLLWSDIDFENDTVCIAAKPEIEGVEAWRPKDYDRRVIPVPRETMDVLTRLHAETPEGSAFVFLSKDRIAWIKAKRERPVHGRQAGRSPTT